MTSTTAKKTAAPTTWQETLTKSANLFAKSATERKKASALLWEGAQAAINDWLPGSDNDVSAEAMYSEVLDVLGASRKGDASKIKTVALAVKDTGLVLADYPNLSRAYAEAIARTKRARQQQVEDDAAEAVIEQIAEAAPKQTTTVDGAALLLLSKGIDGAVVAILDALGSDNEAAHRSFLRAVSTEISARVQAKSQAEKAEKDAERKAEAEAKRAAREAEAKAKREAREAEAAKRKAERAAAAKAKAKTPAKKVAPKAAETKASPKKKAAPVKKASPKATAAAETLSQMADEADVEPISDDLDAMFDDLDETETATTVVNDGVETGPAQPQVKTKARPAVRRPVKR